MRAVHAFAIALAMTMVVSAQQIAPVHVLRISSGSTGSETSGVFTLTDERSVFNRTSDREVIILFQWDHVPGPHKLTAQWRSADGGVTGGSTIDYNATDKRFGARWNIPITSGMSLGVWTIEVTIDGQPAGRHTFEITDAKVATVTRRPLTHDEHYARLNRLFVLLRRSGPDGGELEPAAGFVPAPQTGNVYTILAALDAADSVRAVTPDGATRPMTHLIAGDRRQQWAVLQGAPTTGEPFGIASRDAIKVGTRCISIEGTAAGARVLIGGSITGQAGAPGNQVLIASFGAAFGMPGAPVVDEYGDLLGIVGVGLPGDSRPVDHVLAAREGVGGAPILPLAPFRVPPAPGRELATLRTSGELMPALAVAAQNVFGTFYQGTVRRGDSPSAGVVFSLADPSMRVVVDWSPAERIRGNAVLQVIDADNNVIGVSPGRKVNINKGSTLRSSWDVPMVKAPGFYRVDVTVDGRPYWRGFFRVNP
jgi:hypothetical protein